MLEVLELQGSWDMNSGGFQAPRGRNCEEAFQKKMKLPKKKARETSKQTNYYIIPAYSTYISHMRVSPPPRPEIREIGIGNMDWKRQGGHCPLILQQQQWRRRIQALDFNNPPPAAATCSPQH